MSPDTSNKLSLRSKILLVIVVLVGVILPLQFWYSVWFGRELGDAELEEYLQSVEHPREIQHALARIEEGIRRGDPAIDRWIPRVAALAGHPSEIIRSQAAWVMGQEGKAEAFREALRKLVGDPDPVVRRNAALGLVRFRDREAALPELRRMLQPVTLTAPLAGKIDVAVRVGDAVEPGQPVAEVRGEKVVARFPGRVLWRAEPGGNFAAGAELVRISPDPGSVWEALRALYLLGGREELELVEAIENDADFDPQIRVQARNTREAILSR